ncbi:MAG: hypothetical protein AAF799_17080 [Myxococcota bacterium]
MRPVSVFVVLGLVTSLACTTAQESPAPTKSAAPAKPAAPEAPAAQPVPANEPAATPPVTPIQITPGFVDEATYRRVMGAVMDSLETDLQAWAQRDFSTKEEGGDALAALLAPTPGMQQRLFDVVEQQKVDWTGFGKYLQDNPEVVASMKTEIDERIAAMQKTPEHLAQLERLEALGR